jgi:endonuclease/exonuclease/phosphatase family metal-dependent hydrolase
MKRLRLLIMILCIVCAAALSAKNAKPFRMIDINIWSGTDYQGLLKFHMWETPDSLEMRYQLLLANLKAANPDVIFLQETSPVDRYCRRLAHDLNMNEIHQVCIAGIKIFGIGPPLGFKEGNAILARKGLHLTKLDDWKLSGSTGIYSSHLSFHTDETVAALLGRIDIDGKPVYLICTHLTAAPRDETALQDSLIAMRESGSITNGEYEELLTRWTQGIHRRQREMGKLLENIEKLPANIPMILGGDLNATPHSDVVQDFITRGRFVQLNITPDPEAVTWDAANNTYTHLSQRKTDALGRTRNPWYVFNAIAASLPRRLDYIFLNHVFAGTDSIRSKIILDQPVNGIFPSDHYGIQVDLDISKSLEGVPQLYGHLEKHKYSQSFFPLAYPARKGVGYSAELYLLSALKLNESFDFYLENTTGGDRLYRLTASLPDYKLRQRRKYFSAFDLKAEYSKRDSCEYFGLGHNSLFANREHYNRETEEMSFALSRSFSSYFVGQVGFRYKSVKMSSFKPGGLLDDYFPSDSSTERYSCLFENFRFDTRDSFSNPSRGWLLQEEIEPVTDFSPRVNTFAARLKDCNIKYTLNAQSYTVLWYPKTVLALRVLGQHIANPGGNKDIPLQSLLPLGGEYTLRGSPRERYLGSVMAVANAEIRYHIYYTLGGTLAWDTGKVWNELEGISLAHWPGNPTVGLRYELPDIDLLVRLDLSNFLLRLDVGFGKEMTGFYLNFGQAF